MVKQTHLTALVIDGIAQTKAITIDNEESARMVIFKGRFFKRRLINKEVTASDSPGRETEKKIPIRLPYIRKQMSGKYHGD